MNDHESPDAHCFVPGDAQLTRLARDAGLSADAARAVATIDDVMGRMRRAMMRREFGRAIIARLEAPLEVAHMDVIGAIAQVGGNPEETTVGLVADRLGIDPSRASRLIADVVERGYARRVASQADARRIGLELTDEGKSFIAQVRETKWRVFARALHEWDEDELIIFARLFERFSTWTRDGLGSDPAPAAKAAAE